LAGDGTEKTRLAAGVSTIEAKTKNLSRTPIRSPRTGSFFHDGVTGARIREHGWDDAVRRPGCQPITVDLDETELADRVENRKKPGSQEPGFKYWPRWADTITFQEG
jgi:hypothetical protein